LERIDKIITSRSISGTTVIVGMGSIGSALAVALAAAGCNKVVFFGRRPESNPEVSQHLHLHLPPFSIKPDFQTFLLAQEFNALIDKSMFATCPP
jgi:ketopantoate reductase